MLVPLVLIGGAAYGLLKPDGDSAGPIACGPSRVPLTIVASPSVAPVLTTAAAAFDRGTASWVDGRCTTTTVVSAEPNDFGDTLRAAVEADGGANAPTAWVPDASIWREVLGRRPELSAALPRTFPVVAVSPAVIAAPQPMAEALGWPKSQPSWGELLDLARDPAGWGAKGHPEWGRVRIGWQDPLRDAASLTSMISLSEWATAGAESVEDVRRGLLSAHSALADLHADAKKVLAPLADPTVKAADAAKEAMLLPTSEREVLKFNASKPTTPLVALYPKDGIHPNEVPLMTISGRWVTEQQRAALDRFAVFLVTGEATEHFAADGWRTPRLQTEADTSQGVVASEPRFTPSRPNSWSLAQSLQGWTALDRQGSVLVLLDTSGSMNERVAAAGDATRLDLAKEAIADSLPLFSDRTNIGLWTFSRHENRTDYTVVLDLGPPSRSVGGVTAVQSLQKSLSGLRADGATGLHDTVIAAAGAAQKAWREGNNTIILISDGKNEDPGSATLEQVLAKIEPLASPERPVRILSIALGGEADAATLRRFADAAKGEAYVAREAQDLGKVFLAALTD
ncbi:substrate-binding domain-containing protein [Intrasporangium sp.]|uniref:substrate-binding domain-containing protein n=1 Tax=Intrasporangium sp. TaxID=1925024 RepID=UPI00293A4BC2|nr:substrate-binding domain-containing protein [Intrasporangium sp.]MDV3222860.1 substrate-binding domain-containing protein [Intrasporangium sp.]